MVFRLRPGFVGCLLLGCAAANATELPAGDPRGALPPFVVAVRGAALWADDAHATRVARSLRGGLPLEVLGAAASGRVRVAVHGAISVSGITDLDQLAVQVCQAGLVGDRYYFGNGNVVSLRGGVEDGQVHVGGTVSTAVEHDNGPSTTMRTAFDVRIPLSRLCTSTPAARHAGTKQDPTVGHVPGEIDSEDFPAHTDEVDIAAGETLTLLDAPGGSPIYQREPGRWGFVIMKLRSEHGFDQVALGDGPYLVGWTKSRTPRKRERGALHIGDVIGTMPEGPWALQSAALLSKPLRRLPVSTELNQLGVCARFGAPGYARVMRVENGSAYVVAGVDDNLLVEGWVDEQALGAEVVRK